MTDEEVVDGHLYSPATISENLSCRHPQTDTLSFYFFSKTFKELN